MEQPTHSPESADLKQQLADLRRQTAWLYLGLAVLSLTVAGFIGVQARRAAKDLDLIRPASMQAVETYRKEEPLVKNFVGQLEAYARSSNPDYNQRVFSRYANWAKGTPAPAAPTSVTPGSSAPPAR